MLSTESFPIKEKMELTKTKCAAMNTPKITTLENQQTTSLIFSSLDIIGAKGTHKGPRGDENYRHEDSAITRSMPSQRLKDSKRYKRAQQDNYNVVTRTMLSRGRWTSKRYNRT